MTVIEQAERKVKALQKEFLAWAEAHPMLHQLHPQQFNDLRRCVFRGTFAVYRMGVVGQPSNVTGLSQYFVGWLNDAAVDALHPTYRVEVMDKCFATALEAFRIGIMVAFSKKSEDLFGAVL